MQVSKKVLIYLLLLNFSHSIT